MVLERQAGRGTKRRVTKSNGGKWEDEGRKWKGDKEGELVTTEEGSQESKGESGKEDKGRNERGEVRRAGLKQRSILLFFPSLLFLFLYHPSP